MRINYLLATVFIVVSLLSTLANADIQTVIPSQTRFQVDSTDIIKFSVNYSASSPNQTTGLGLKINYDSGQLQLIEVSEVFSKDKIAQAEEVKKTTETDASNKSINIAWVSLNGSWPDSLATTASEGTKLLTVTFRVTDGFVSPTTIFMTGNASAGNNFQSTPIVIDPRSKTGTEAGGAGAMPAILLLLLSSVLSSAFVKKQIERV